MSSKPDIKYLVFLLMLFFAFTYSHAQNLKVKSTNLTNVEQVLRQYVFDGNKEVQILNAKYIGANGQMSGFDATGTSLGMTQGMIMSSGSVYSAEGPWNADTVSYDWMNYDRDFDLGGHPLRDLARLHFDFVTSGSGLKINFIWGSDEYADTFATDTSKPFNSDKFRLFIQGPGFGDGFNYVNVGVFEKVGPLAIDTFQVNTRTVNNGSVNGGPCMNCEYYNDNLRNSYAFTAMPGFTSVFTKSFNVLPCDTYHVFIAIWDGLSNYSGEITPNEAIAGFGYMDSYLLFNMEVTQPPSYFVVDKFKIGNTSYYIDSVAYEGCDYAEVRIERYVNIEQAGTVNLTYTGNAVPGLDYEPLPSSVYFAPNQRVVILQLRAKKNDAATGDRIVIVNNTNEVCGVQKHYQKNYFIRKPNLNIDLGPDTSLCEGLKYNLNASTNPPPEYYVWNDSTSGPYKTVTNTGKYSVRARIGTCMKTDTVSVYFKPLVKFTLGPDSSICLKDSVKLNPKLSLADTAIKYKWNDNSILPTKTVGSTGTYWLAVTKNGCTNYDTMNLNVKPLPPVNIGPDTVLCYAINPSYPLFANTDPSNNILWNTGATGLATIATQSGLYYVRVRGNGCNNYDTAKVTFYQTPPVNLRDTLVCNNAVLRLRAPKGFTYVWSNGSTDSAINVFTPGTYSVIASNGPCVAKDTSVVTHKPAPVFNLGNDTALCTGESFVIDGTYSTDIVNYMWSKAALPCFNKPTCKTRDGGYYVLAITSQTNGCTSKDSILLTVKPLPAPSLGKDTAICFNQVITLSPNCAYDSLRWWDLSQGATNTFNKPGDYWVKVYKDRCMNADTISAFISPLSPPFTQPHDTGFCLGKSVTYDVSCIGCTYLWDDFNTSPLRVFNKDTKRTVTITNPACSRTDTVVVRMVVPVSVFPDDTIICNGQWLKLTNPLAGYKFKWYDNTIVPEKNVNVARKYWINYERFGCKFSDTVNLEYVGGPSLDLGSDVTTCTINPILLDASNKGPTTYLWNTGSTAPTVYVDSAGLYAVEVTRCGITEKDEVFVDYVSKSIKLFMPNAFTPDNNDALNDELVIGGKVKQLKTYSFSVYNNWGQKVFETKDITKGWDGTYNGNKLPGGVYLWTVDASSDCYIDPYYHASGNVTLLR